MSMLENVCKTVFEKDKKMFGKKASAKKGGL